MARANVLQTLAVLIALVLASLNLNAAQPPAALSLEAPGDYSIGLYSQWLEDPTLNLSIDDAMQAEGWQTSTEASLNFGYSDSVYWLRTRIHAGSLHDWALWIRYSLLDYVEFYLCPQPYDGEAGCQKRLAGDEVPFKLGRDVNHPNLIVRFPMEQGQEYLLVMRVQSNGAYQIPASLVDEKTLQNELETNNLIRGGYYATMLVMGLYNLFIFFQTRERSYLYYTLVTVTFLIFHMTYEGSAFQYFWPETPSLNQYALPLMFLVNQIFLSLFVPNFLNLKKHSPGAHRLFRVYTAISGMLLIMLPLIPYAVMLPVINLLSTVVLISALLIGIVLWVQGRPAARFLPERSSAARRRELPAAGRGAVSGSAAGASSKASGGSSYSTTSSVSAGACGGLRRRVAAAAVARRLAAGRSVSARWLLVEGRSAAGRERRDLAIGHP